jgi:hypothetical protein
MLCCDADATVDKTVIRDAKNTALAVHGGSEKVGHEKGALTTAAIRAACTNEETFRLARIPELIVKLTVESSDIFPSRHAEKANAA